MAVNRVDYNNNTLINLTSDTVTAADLPAGVTAHDRSGTPITGTANYQTQTMSSPITIGAETETTVEGAIGELADLVPSTAVPATNKLATAGDVNGEEIAVTSTTSPLTTSAAHPRKITIYGKSEVVDGDIHSAGEGWATVDLGTLTWNAGTDNVFYTTVLTDKKLGESNILCPKYSLTNAAVTDMPDKTCRGHGTDKYVYIRDTTYTDTATFTTAMSGVILAYQLADPTQGNVIAVKTDDTTGVDGTMAVLETGTPLRGIIGGARDVATWGGVSGEVTNNCAELDLGTLSWVYTTTYNYPFFRAEITDMATGLIKILSAKYNVISPTYLSLFGNNAQNLDIAKRIAENGSNQVMIRDDNYNNVSDFTASLTGVRLIYELSTPITIPFTATENVNFAALQTYSPQTAIRITDNPEFEVEAYAGTANGKAVSELEEKVQKQLDDKITVSSTLTLAANAWSNNAQTVTFAHDTTKRNVIDITPSEVPAWGAAGVYASDETSAGITFTCATVPETALTFKVTCMEVS